MSTALQTKQAGMMSTIDGLLASIDATSTKKADEANTEAGGYQGNSTHPSTKVDDRTEEASEGSRSSENTSDVKEDQGTPSVDNTAEIPTGTAADDHLQIGTNVQSTGDDPSNETSGTKATKDDPGSSHPARTDNNELDGMKYSSIDEEFDVLSKQASAIGTDLIAMIANDANDVTKQASTPAKPAKATPAPQAAAAPPAAQQVGAKEAAQAGYDLAGAVADNTPAFDKAALDRYVINEVATVVASAESMGEKVAQFLNSRNAALKQAEDGPPRDDDSSSDDSGSGDDSSGGGDSGPPHSHGGDPTGGDPTGGGGGGTDDKLLALLAGGQGMGAGDAAGGMMGGGDPTGGAGGGMPPGADAGGMPPGAAGGMPPGADPMAGAAGAGGAGGDPLSGMGGGDGMAMLQQALMEAGITPEQLVQALHANKTAAAKATKTASAKWEAKTAEDRKKLAKLKDYILEVCSKK